MILAGLQTSVQYIKLHNCGFSLITVECCSPKLCVCVCVFALVRSCVCFPKHLCGECGQGKSKMTSGNELNISCSDTKRVFEFKGIGFFSFVEFTLLLQCNIFLETSTMVYHHHHQALIQSTGFCYMNLNVSFRMIQSNLIR